MKKFLILFACGLLSFASYAQYGYAFCETYNAVLTNGDSTTFDVDGDGQPDVKVNSFVDGPYGKAVILTSFKPYNGQHSDYNQNITFKVNAVGFIRNYATGTTLDGYSGQSDAFYNTALLTREVAIGREFEPGYVGTMCYRHNRGFTVDNTIPSFPDTTFYWCVGWIKFYVSANYDTVTAISSCGCDQNNMISGYTSPETAVPVISPEKAIVRQNGKQIQIEYADSENGTVEVYNLLGQLLLSGTLHEGTNEFNLNALPVDMMLISVKDKWGNRVGVYKILPERF